MPPASRHPTERHALRLVVFLGLGGVATPALAYLDPSTGSMILSAVIGLFATAGLAVKTYWYKLRNFFRGRPASPGRSGSPAAGTPGSPGSGTPSGEDSHSRAAD